MSTVTSREATRLAAGQMSGLVVSGLGVLFGVVEFAHILAMTTPMGIVLEAVVPFLGALGLVVAGSLLWTGAYEYDALPTGRVVGWVLVGMAVLGVIFLWILAHQVIRGGQFHHAHFILVNNLIAGSLLGFVVGTYDARSQAYRRRIEQEQLKHGFLNRELRHHVLNGLTVILGRIDRIEKQVDGDVLEDARTIRKHGREITERVENVRQIARTFTDEEPTSLEPQHLPTVLRNVAEEIDDRYERATVELDVDDDVGDVLADQYLPIVFENLLSNGVEHNDLETPTVTLTAASSENGVTVTVADDGPGFTEREREALLEWDASSDGRVGMGVGLAIVKVLVDRYRGRVWLDDDQSSGAVISVELRTASD